MTRPLLALALLAAGIALGFVLGLRTVYNQPVNRDGPVGEWWA